MPLMVVAALVLGACGSTLQPTSGSTELSGGAPQITVGETTPRDLDATGDGPARTEGDGGQPGDEAAAGDADASTAADASGPPTHATADGQPGQTAGTGTAQADTGVIRVGVAGVNANALFAAFGADEQADPQAPDRAIIEYINANGGVDGRQIDPVYFLADVAADQNAEAQRACEKFTTDNDVDLAIVNGLSNDVFLSCLGHRGVAVVDSARWVPDAPYVSRFANWLAPNALGVDRYAATALQLSIDQGIIQAGDKLGVLYEDCPWGGRVYENVVKPIAGSAGIDTERATVKCIENLVSDLGPVTNQSTAAALRFGSSGVTHVLTLSVAEGYVVGRFTSGASQQRYQPHYIVTTNGFPYNNSDPDNIVHFDPGAVQNMTGIGWMPYIDVGVAQQFTPGQEQRQAECRNAVEPLGEPTYEDEGDRINGWGLTYELCDLYFGARDILAASGGDFSMGSVTAAYRRTMDSSVSRVLNGGRRRSSTSDGVGFVQTFEYDAASNRFAYASSLHPTG